MRQLLPLLLWTACTPDDQVFREKNPGGTDSTTPVTSTGSTTATTGTTSTSSGTGTSFETDFDCNVPPPSPPFQIDSFSIGTQEDFDFSAGGYLVYQDLGTSALIGVDRSATGQVISSGTAGDPRGIHGLSDGRVVIMSIWDGTIRITDPSTAGIETLAGNLDLPNGIDVGANDRIFFSTYGELGWIDVDGSDYQIVHTFAGGEYGNGVALNAAQDKVTVAVSDNLDTYFVSLDKLGPDDWGNPRVEHTVNGFHTTVEYDVCGNLYTADYTGGQLYRITPDGTIEELASFGSGAFSALRFGPGHSGWERDRLYVSNRNSDVHEVFIGVPGVPHPTSP